MRYQNLWFYPDRIFKDKYNLFSQLLLNSLSNHTSGSEDKIYQWLPDYLQRYLKHRFSKNLLYTRYTTLGKLWNKLPDLLQNNIVHVFRKVKQILTHQKIGYTTAEVQIILTIINKRKAETEQIYEEILRAQNKDLGLLSLTTEVI